MEAELLASSSSWFVCRAVVVGSSELPPPTAKGRVLRVLKRSVPRTLASAFGLRLVPKAQRSKTCVLGRR